MNAIQMKKLTAIVAQARSSKTVEEVDSCLNTAREILGSTEDSLGIISMMVTARNQLVEETRLGAEQVQLRSALKNTV